LVGISKGVLYPFFYTTSFIYQGGVPKIPRAGGDTILVGVQYHTIKIILLYFWGIELTETLKPLQTLGYIPEIDLFYYQL